MDDYLLGHDQTEWSRLAAQHALWRDSLLDILPLREGQSVLEVGCGSGALLADLADRVGPTGRCVGLERDGAAAAAARSHTASRPWVTIQQGDLRDSLPAGPWDVVVARWVLSFLPDAADCVALLAQAVRPGGWLVVQDYNHDGVRLFPDVPSFNRVIEAYRAAYARQGGDLWIAGRLPGMMQAAGLTVTTIDPQVMAGPPNSPVWRWVERFVFAHLDSVSTDGPPQPDRLSPSEQAALRQDWAAARQRPDTVLFSPMQVTVMGSQPAGRS